VQSENQLMPAVVALAGRRMDATGTEPPRFPLENVPVVRKRLAAILAKESAMALVCSAACGADLIALEEAERLGLRRRIVLPFSPERFRETSVIDRPGNWGPVFDRLVTAARATGDLVVLEDAGDSDKAYAAANKAIIDQAQMLAKTGSAPRRMVAVVVWEGAARVGNDATQGFRDLGAKAGFEERSVTTL